MSAFAVRSVSFSTSVRRFLGLRRPRLSYSESAVRVDALLGVLDMVNSLLFSIELYDVSYYHIVELKTASNAIGDPHDIFGCPAITMQNSVHKTSYI